MPALKPYRQQGKELRNLTLPETNIFASENGWLEYVGIRSFPFGSKGLFSGAICWLVFGGCTCLIRKILVNLQCLQMFFFLQNEILWVRTFGCLKFVSPSRIADVLGPNIVYRCILFRGFPNFPYIFRWWLLTSSTSLDAKQCLKNPSTFWRAV